MVVVCINAQESKGKARVRGVVCDQNGNPISGVKVNLYHVEYNFNLFAETNAKGEWLVTWIRGGKYNIDFEKNGYVPKKISVNIKESARSAVIEVNIEKLETPTLSNELEDSLDEANGLYMEGKYEEAILIYKGMIKNYPNAYIIHENIGNAYYQLEKYDRAIEHYITVLENDPGNNQAKVSIGNSYASLGDDNNARIWYNKIDLQKISDPNILFNIGTDYYAFANYEEALKFFQRAVELKEDFLDAVYQLGLAHLALNQQNEAIHVFESYLKKDPDSERSSQVKGFIEFLKK